MNGTTSSSSSLRALCSFHPPRRSLVVPTASRHVTISSSFSHPRRRRRRRSPRRLQRPDPHQNPISSVDLEDIADRATSALTLHLRRLLSAGAEAFRDLRTSVRADPADPADGRIVLSCRPSSVRFLLWTLLAAAVAVRVSAVLASSLRGRGRGRPVVVRRDRSLGGREVVVGSSGGAIERKSSFTKIARSGVTERRTEKLPEWWPSSVATPTVESVWKEEFQKEANRLLRAITDNRMSGMDYKDDDIVQLRHICKTSGAKVSFATGNTRDSFFRASVDFVLNTCSRVARPTATVQINGEEARKFICGLAENIGLENTRAARIICAAVAARTRACLLQSWALEGQGKRIEALEELSKICRIFQTFPPEENSPEMEMVASSLEKNLGIEQRQHLLVLFEGVCSSDCHRIVEEALGLVSNQSAKWQSSSFL
ncbi:uncharacterized protein M6B38_409325 [Iris pallida]|uniref:Uncharacterized protein n=1 Tax=Iris pallida TaxID=29817 RepID=A0AAX6FNA0_IRIPA|nr:uncharacterized protein M6B38_409325 [Iris pallida]